MTSLLGKSPTDRTATHRQPGGAASQPNRRLVNPAVGERGAGGLPAGAVVLHFLFQSLKSFLPEKKSVISVLYCSFLFDVTLHRLTKNITIVSRIKV